MIQIPELPDDLHTKLLDIVDAVVRFEGLRSFGRHMRQRFTTYSPDGPTLDVIVASPGGSTETTAATFWFDGIPGKLDKDMYMSDFAAFLDKTVAAGHRYSDQNPTGVYYLK